MKINFTFLVLLLLWAFSSMSQPSIGLQQIASGFTRPVDIVNCGDNRLFIVEQAGIIKIINAQGTVNSRPFLNIVSKVESGGNEQGLLGMVFHPDYKNNGYFYVNYIDKGAGFGNTTISRFQVSANDPDSAVASSEQIIFTISQPYGNHNAGDMNFGPDGYLYFGLGDGGSGNDPGNRAQNPQNLLGKMIRIDVDTAAGYKIPPTNPFINDPNTLDEIWALGLRNPWRFSFDRLTGDIWIGDVGQNAREEVDFQPASSSGGENYGWRCYEANRANLTSGCAPQSSYVAPVYEYVNPTSGCTVVGGYVYRGCLYPNLYGHYVFADYCSGRFWTMINTGGSWVATSQGSFSNSFTTFGEDRNGELYVAGFSGGRIYRVTESLPATLPTVAVNGSTSFCDGDSVVFSTQPGYASYTWFLNESPVDTGLQFTATAGGSYELKVTGNNGCFYRAPAVDVSVFDLPSPVISSNDTAFCDGDSLQLDAGNFSSYNWTDGFMSSPHYVSSPGNYSVTVTDANGCSGSSPAVQIAEHANPVPIITVGNDIILCEGDSIVLSTTLNYATYQWSTQESSAQIVVKDAGFYTVTVQDANGCEGSSAGPVVTLSPVPPVATITQQDNMLSVPDTGYFYQWYVNGDLIPGADEQTLPVFTNGEYTVTLTNDAGCSTLSVPYKAFINGINEAWVQNISVQPNPFEAEILIRYQLLSATNLQVRFTDLAGKEIKILPTENRQPGYHELILRPGDMRLSQGTYLLEISNGLSRKTFKLIKL